MRDEGLREVRYDLYCEKCEHKDLGDYDMPCRKCLAEPANQHTDRPVMFKEKTK